MPIVISGTNGISGVDGTASNPSYEGTDANTGVFFPAADTVAIATGGSERVRVDSSGTLKTNVGGVEGIQLATDLNSSTVSSRLLFSETGSTLALLNSSGNLFFNTGVAKGSSSGTTRVVFNANGVGLGGSTPSSGTGIAFPATQSASSDANTLDDYEEGTFTPSALVSITGAIGRYTKIGRVVQWSCCFTMSSNANGNAAYIGNLPFLCENNNGARAGSVISFTDYGSSNITILFAANDVSAYFYNYSGIALTNANLSGKTIFCGGTYLTNT